MDVRLLDGNDAEALECYLSQHAESAMHMRSNMQEGGLDDHGQPLQATYAALIIDDKIAGVVSHTWNGYVLVQADRYIEPLVRLAVLTSGRPIKGIMGPLDQVVAARATLGLIDIKAAVEGKDHLYRLMLADMTEPKELSPHVTCRRARDDEAPYLAEWLAEFSVQSLGATPGPELTQRSQQDIQTPLRLGRVWVAYNDGGEPCASLTLTTLTDIANVGFVYTPAAQRRQGYARTLVYNVLRTAQNVGIKRAVLTVEPENTVACRTYQAIGFTKVADTGLVLFEPAQKPRLNTTAH